jgi:hypothetical protein
MTNKGQISIPLSVHIAARPQAGDNIYFPARDGNTITMRAQNKNLRHLSAKRKQLLNATATKMRR